MGNWYVKVFGVIILIKYLKYSCNIYIYLYKLILALLIKLLHNGTWWVGLIRTVQLYKNQPLAYRTGVRIVDQWFGFCGLILILLLIWATLLLVRGLFLGLHLFRRGRRGPYAHYLSIFASFSCIDYDLIWVCIACYAKSSLGCINFYFVNTYN